MAANGVSGPHGMDATVPAPAPVAVSLDGVTFGDVLRAINPLQYVPVVGTIYRLATGDEAPSGLRTAVSAITGLLMGGPIGLLGSIAGQLAEHFLHLEGRARNLVAHGSLADPLEPAPAAQVAGLPPAPAAGGATQAIAAYREAGALGMLGSV